MIAGSRIPAVAVDKMQATLAQVVTTMLGIGLNESNLFPAEQSIAGPAFDAETLCSCVRFHGSWRGACCVTCQPRVGEELTHRFLGLEAGSPDVVLLKIRDCMGEVANIVGGNIKGLLPRGVDHSLPEFGGWRLTEGRPLVVAAFNCTAGPLWISLIEEGPAI